MNIGDLVYFMRNNEIQQAEIKEIRVITYKDETTRKISTKVLYLVDFWTNEPIEVNSTDCFFTLDDIIDYLKTNFKPYLIF